MEKMYYLTVNGTYLGVYTETFCREYCKQFANTQKINAKETSMIYTLEKRNEFGNGKMTTHYEVRSYTHKTPIGILANGNTLKSGTKAQCEKYIRTKGIKTETD